MERNGLEFEKPLFEIERMISDLEGASAKKGMDLSAQINQLKAQYARETQRVYSNLSAWDRVLVARHRDRPTTTDYLNLMVTDFVELHGDRSFRDDRAILTGFGMLDDQKILLVAHRKGKTVAEKRACNWGCAHPEGYRKALLKMKLAEKFRVPILCLIDTMGAYPGVEAEERGEAQAIAQNIYEMSQLRTSIVCVVIGEGGSGGAIGIGVGDRLCVLEYAYYSVISPEGCAAILWRSGDRRREAAQALRLTARDLLDHGIADEIVPEPLGGAHRDHRKMAATLKETALRHIRELEPIPLDQLVEQRWEKYRRIGYVIEGTLDETPPPVTPTDEGSEHASPRAEVENPPSDDH